MWWLLELVGRVLWWFGYAATLLMAVMVERAFINHYRRRHQQRLPELVLRMGGLFFAFDLVLHAVTIAPLPYPRLA